MLAASKFPRSAILADGDRMRTRFSVMTGEAQPVVRYPCPWEHRIREHRIRKWELILGLAGVDGVVL